MRRLFLHIGAHKTGTTALQQGLHQNRAILAQRGASYVAAPSVAHLHKYLGYRQAGQLLPEGFAVQDLPALAAQLAAAPGDLVIGSSENFSFFFQAEAVQALAGALKPHFGQISIVSYLRRQDRHAVSHHQEGAKPHRQAEGELWGHAAQALPVPSPEQALYLDYDRRMGLWADAFGEDAMILRIYDRAWLKDGDILADFLEQLGIDGADMMPVGDRNVSLGAAQANAGHVMNEMGVKPRVMEQVLGQIADGGRLLPSRAGAQAFLEPYRESNRRLNARFRVSDLPELFPDDFDDLPEVAQDAWSEAGATAALRAALGQALKIAPALAALTPDDLRNAALALQARLPESALRLVTAAQALRPTGPTILKLKADLERKLSEG